MIPDTLLFQVVPHLGFVDPLWFQKVCLSALGALVLSAGIVFFRYYRTHRVCISHTIPKENISFIFPSQDDPDLLIRTIHLIRLLIARQYADMKYLYFSLEELRFSIPNDTLLSDLDLLESWYYQGKRVDQTMRESISRILSEIQKTSRQYM